VSTRSRFALRSAGIVTSSSIRCSRPSAACACAFARTACPVDHAELAAAIAAGLRGCGVPDPDVVVEEVPSLSRQVSGKLKRFVPL
jgi:hypothetical protein